jgi:hypothetical protein
MVRYASARPSWLARGLCSVLAKFEKKFGNHNS